MFLSGHATHPDWRIALALAAAQLEAQRAQQSAMPATLGWVYLTDHYAPHAAPLLAELQQRWPGVDWVGAVGIGVSASGVEYFDEPALSLLLCNLPRSHYRLFSGGAPLGTFAVHSAQVHVDPSTADAAELIAEMSARTASGYLFGGVASARTQAWQIANGLFQGGLSGLAVGPEVSLISRVTQGCQPVGPTRRITRSESNRVAQLDDEPALDCLLRDLGLTALDHREALAQLRQTLVGLVDAGEASDEATPRTGQFGPATRVRHLLGLTPLDRGLAIAEQVEPGTQLTFCRRNTEAARRDLVRICSEIREEVEGQGQDVPSGQPGTRIAAAIYISCTGRGGPHFGGPSAELAIVRHALGDVPLAGFFAGGEIAHHHLYGYTGVLTVFTGPA
ncbi:MAG: FIST C-terminal domain-containing protein [Burkholderiaceae bacterium]|nr:FIST C-terminal domain-containing protein [Burkholderiaceae bacterium]